MIDPLASVVWPARRPIVVASDSYRLKKPTVVKLRASYVV
jgi:hypothetical protein